MQKSQYRKDPEAFILEHLDATKRTVEYTCSENVIPNFRGYLSLKVNESVFKV